jgi:hypothetical protein
VAAYAVELAAITHTPLPMVLDMPLDEMLTWHAETALFAGAR